MTSVKRLYNKDRVLVRFATEREIKSFTEELPSDSSVTIVEFSGGIFVREFLKADGAEYVYMLLRESVP